MMYTLHTHLRVPYDTCVNHIRKNLKKTLQVRIIRQDKPDIVDILPLESIKNMAITHMEEDICNDSECLYGNMIFNGNFYRFNTHNRSYDVVILMEKTSYPFHKMKMVLPITSNQYEHQDNQDYIIHIPSEYTNNEKVVPIEFIWEFLSQLQPFLDTKMNI